MKLATTVMGILVLSFISLAQPTQPVSVGIPEVAQMDIEPNNSGITLSLDPPTEAGNQTQNNTDNSKWINYSSAIEPGGSNRQILAQITAGSLPSGVELRLTASGYVGGGQGAFGTSTSTIIISSSPQAIVTGIGRTFTGNGVSNGHQLNYELAVDDFGSLDSDDSQIITVTFTMVDN
jgi:hypothetical protein